MCDLCHGKLGSASVCRSSRPDGPEPFLRESAIQRRRRGNKCQVVGEQSDRKSLRLQQRKKKNSLSIHIRSGSFAFWQLEADLIAVNDVMIDSDGPVNNRQDLFLPAVFYKE